jgi:hypothetical protein
MYEQKVITDLKKELTSKLTSLENQIGTIKIKLDLLSDLEKYCTPATDVKKPSKPVRGIETKLLRQEMFRLIQVGDTFETKWLLDKLNFTTMKTDNLPEINNIQGKVYSILMCCEFQKKGRTTYTRVK